MRNFTSVFSREIFFWSQHSGDFRKREASLKTRYSSAENPSGAFFYLKIIIIYYFSPAACCRSV